MILDGLTVLGVVLVNVYVLYNLFFLFVPHKHQIPHLRCRIFSTYVFFGIVLATVLLPVTGIIIYSMVTGKFELGDYIHSAVYNEVTHGISLFGVIAAIAQGISFCIYAKKLAEIHEKEINSDHFTKA